MTHYAHTPIPLDFMSETRFMTEKSSTSATRQPAICRGDRSGRPSNKERAAGQCRRSVPAVSVYATCATCATIRSQPSLPYRKRSLSRHKKRKNQGKITQYLYCMYKTTAISILYLDTFVFFRVFSTFSCVFSTFSRVFSPLFRPLLTVPAFIRRQFRKCRTSLIAPQFAWTANIPVQALILWRNAASRTSCA